MTRLFYKEKGTPLWEKIFSLMVNIVFPFCIYGGITLLSDYSRSESSDYFSFSDSFNHYFETIPSLLTSIVFGGICSATFHYLDIIIEATPTLRISVYTAFFSFGTLVLAISNSLLCVSFILV